MKDRLLRLALAVPFLIVCAWPRTSVAQAAIGYAVVSWGDNFLTTVPVAAQSGVTAIAAGYNYTVALKNDGSVVLWGNSYQQSTVPDEAQSGVTAIAAGYYCTVALKNDGAVVAWGSNEYGQLRVPLAAQSGVMAIAAGWAHTVALKNDGTVVAWGHNAYGQTTVPVAAQSGVTAIAAGDHHTVALKADGSVVAWGLNDFGQRTVPVAARSGVTDIAAGGNHTLALKNDGSVVSWGSLGQTTVPVAAQGGVTAISTGGAHAVALKNDGTVVAWGHNGYGQTTVPVAAQSGVRAIAAGSWHTVALVTPTVPIITTPPVHQTVNEWQSATFNVGTTGYPLNYQWRKDGLDIAGATSATYSRPFTPTNQAGSYTVVVSNSLGIVTSAPPAVLTISPAAAGAVVAWGTKKIFGQTPTPLAAQSGVVAIAAAGGHTAALKEDGTVMEWGDYAMASPVTLGGQVLSGVTAIAAAGSCFFGCSDYTVALKDDGSVVSWGSLDQTMVPVAAQSGVAAIAAGDYHTVALKNDGTVVAWGDNRSGQVTGIPPPKGPYDAIANPFTLGDQVLSGVTAIAAGESHTVALKKDGTVVAWGYNRSGQVTSTPSTKDPYFEIASPVTLGNQILSDVTAIAAGRSHTVALKNDGAVVVWGFDASGLTEVPMSAQSGVTAIAAGGSHTVALKSNGTVVAWGWTGFSEVDPVTLGGQVLSGVTAIAATDYYAAALIGGAQLLPSLNARPDGNNLVLSWRTNAPGFTLQSTLDLTPPVIWIDSTSVPAVIGSHFTLTNATSGGTRFYRLRKM